MDIKWTNIEKVSRTDISNQTVCWTHGHFKHQTNKYIKFNTNGYLNNHTQDYQKKKEKKRKAMDIYKTRKLISVRKENKLISDKRTNKHINKN